MSIEKAQLKIHITNDLGATIEDRLEGERRAMFELSGAATALRQASEKVPRDLAALVDKDLEEGKITDGLDAPHVVGLIKKYLTRVADFLGHLADVEKQKSIVQGGRVAGMEEAVAVVKRVRDDTVARVEQVLKAVEDDQVISTDLRSQAGAARAAHGTLAERRAAAMRGETPAESAPVNSEAPSAPTAESVSAPAPDAPAEQTAPEPAPEAIPAPTAPPPAPGPAEPARVKGKGKRRRE